MDSDNPFQTAQTIDPEVRAYVYSLVTALGGTSQDDNGVYVLGDDALACLRDLKRWLKLYDEKTNRLDVARCLAEAKLVNGDLLPILALWPEQASNDRVKARLALACLELLVPLTWPLENGGDMTVNHHRHTPYIQQAQVLYKAGVLSHETSRILRTVVRIGLPSIAMPREDRNARDEGIIKLMLYFLRNIAVITPLPNLPSSGLEDEVSRSATIEAFRLQDVFALLLTMCSNMGDDFNTQDVIILEILFNLVKGVDVEKLWMTNKQKMVRQTNELKDVLGKERAMHRGYARMAPSRHGRFGTMVWQKGEDERMWAVSGQENLIEGGNTLHNIDKSKRWNKPQQRRKDIDHSIHDFDRSVHLTPSASELLRTFVEEFLDSGSNPLFIHLRKAIEREAERVLDVNYRQFFYVVSWFLQAERARRERQKKDQQNGKLQTDFEAESYALVAGVLNQETFVTLNRFMQSSFDNKEWQDLNASMRCFTQILLMVQEMAQSPLEEDQDIADNIQNRIFYEETTHDRIVSVLKGYKDQGFGYLDACTELSHVFLRMLERYSKENVDLQVRSRRRARQKKKQERENTTADGAEDEDEQSENEDLVQAAQVSRERKFDFNRFATKFTSQSSVDTFVVFTTFYRELSVEQLKRAHRFFYRVAFKQDLTVLLYRVDIIALFYKLVKGPEGLDVAHDVYKDWNELVRQILKKLFKKLEQRPELMVEMLFSKINATLYYLEFGREKQTTTSSRARAELEVKPAPGRGITEQIGIVVGALERDGKSPLIEWINAALRDARDQRKGWEGEEEARKEIQRLQEGEKDGNGNNDKSLNPEQPRAPDIVIHAANDEVRSAMFKNARLKLLMTLVGFERLGDEDLPGARWIIPSTLTSTALEESLTTVERFKDTPWVNDANEETPEDLLRRVTKKTTEDDEDALRDAFIDDSEGSDGMEEFMFPDNIRSKTTKTSNGLEELKKRHLKRKRKEKKEGDSSDDDEDEAEQARRRKARKDAALERRRKIKSNLYIRDSDDETDEEANREFFSREEEGRKRQAQRIMEAMRLGRVDVNGEKPSEGGEQQQKGGREKKRKVSKEIADDGEEDEAMSSDDGTVSAAQLDRGASDDEDAAEEAETPLSSQVEDAVDQETSRSGGLKEIPQPRLLQQQSTVRKKMAAEADREELGEEEYEEDGIPAAVVSATAPRRRFRAGFIVDSDDED